MQKSGASIDDFEILNKLGEGAFGTVNKVKRKSNGKFYALKKVKMQKLSHKEKENALNEIRILASLNSPYIIKYKDAFYDESSSCLCIVMEFAANGDLQGKIATVKKQRITFDESIVWEYSAQLLMGLKNLHDMNILHRDLKGANVFLNEDGKMVKLGDLNVSKVAKSNIAYTQTGTPYYLSPEVWRGQPYNHKCDVWSLGCVIYEMVCLEPPFQANSLEELYKKVLKGNYNKIPSKYSMELSKFISNCLIISPQNRPAVKDLLELPQIKSRIVIDKAQQKQQLLNTIKLPYGCNMNQLKNQLPKAKYDEDNLEVIKEVKEFRQERPQSARGRTEERPIEKPIQTPVQVSSKQPNPQIPQNQINSNNYKPTNQPSQQNNYNSNQQNSQQRVNSANPYQNRASSQEKLYQNYQNNNFQYNNRNIPPSYRKEEIKQETPNSQKGLKPPMPQGQIQQGGKPPMNPQQQLVKPQIGSNNQVQNSKPLIKDDSSDNSSKPKNFNNQYSPSNKGIIGQNQGKKHYF